MLETEMPKPAGFGEAEERIAFAGGRSRAVAAGEPALHHLELLAEAGIVGHENQAALRLRGGFGGLQVVTVDGRTVGHAAPDDPGGPGAGIRPGDRDTRIGAPYVRVKRTQLGLRIGVVVEVVEALVGRWSRGQGLAGLRMAGRPASHHLGHQHLARQGRCVRAGRLGRLSRGAGQDVLELLDILSQLAQRHETAVAEHRVSTIGRIAKRRRLVGEVRVAAQNLAEMHLIGIALAGLALVQHRIRSAVGETEMVLHAGSIPLPLHPLNRERPDARIHLDQAAHFGHQRSSRIRRRLRVFIRVLGQQAKLKDGMDGAHADARRRIIFAQVRRTDAERPVACRKAPALGMIPAHVAEQAGASLHALHKLFRQCAHLRVGQSGVAQPLDRECDVGNDLPRGQGVGFGRHLQDFEKSRQRGRTGELQEQQAAVIRSGVGGQDPALHVAAILQRQFGRQGERQLAPHRRHVGRRHQPEQGLFIAKAGARDAFGVNGVVDHGDEFRQQLVGGPMQNHPVMRPRRIEVGQMVERRQRAYAVAKRRPAGSFDGERLAEAGIGRIDADLAVDLEYRASRNVLRRRNSDLRDDPIGAWARGSPIDALLHPQEARIIHGQVRGGIEEIGFGLPALEPDAPVFVGVLVTEHIALGIAEDEVEQPRGLLPDDADIGFPGAVERRGQQHIVHGVLGIVLGFEHGDAHGVDASDAVHGVRQHTGELVFIRAGASAIQRPQHVFDSRLVRRRVQGRHEPLLDRSHHPEIRRAGHAAGLDGQIPAHVSTPLVRAALNCAIAKMQLLRFHFRKHAIWLTIFSMRA